MADPTAGDLLLGWQFDPASLLLVGLSGVLYAEGVRRLAGRGRRWSPARTAAMAAALVVAVVATQSGIARHEDARMWVHMIQHVLLGMVVPLLAVLAAPLTLALQACGPATRRSLRSALRSRAAHLVAHPIVAWALFGGGLVAIYLTPVLDLSGAKLNMPPHMYDKVSRAGITNLRLAQYKPDVVRLVLELDSSREYEVTRTDNEIRVAVTGAGHSAIPDSTSWQVNVTVTSW